MVTSPMSDSSFDATSGPTLRRSTRKPNRPIVDCTDDDEEGFPRKRVLFVPDQPTVIPQPGSVSPPVTISSSEEIAPATPQPPPQRRSGRGRRPNATTAATQTPATQAAATRRRSAAPAATPPPKRGRPSATPQAVSLPIPGEVQAANSAAADGPVVGQNQSVTPQLQQMGSQNMPPMSWDMFYQTIGAIVHNPVTISSSEEIAPATPQPPPQRRSGRGRRPNATTAATQTPATQAAATRRRSAAPAATPPAKRGRPSATPQAMSLPIPREVQAANSAAADGPVVSQNQSVTPQLQQMGSQNMPPMSWDMFYQTIGAIVHNPGVFDNYCRLAKQFADANKQPNQ
uniref:Uncharacterized protein n=1 Tax=Panagrolaimus sp. JU765 TaxID=591449 RepID=A0AC34QN23_9BILA